MKFTLRAVRPKLAALNLSKLRPGSNGRGASLKDIEIMRSSCGLQIKASGGIKTFEQAVALINAGASRLGTSSGVELVSGLVAQPGY